MYITGFGVHISDIFDVDAIDVVYNGFLFTLESVSEQLADIMTSSLEVDFEYIKYIYAAYLQPQKFIF